MFVVVTKGPRCRFSGGKSGQEARASVMYRGRGTAMGWDEENTVAVPERSGN